MPPRLRFVLIALLGCFLLAAGVATGAGLQQVGPTDGDDSLFVTTDTPDEPPTSQNETVTVSPTNTTLIIQLEPDGDARWTILERFNLSSDIDRMAFQETADAFESGDSEGSDLGLAAFRRAVALVDERTDRQMRIADSTVERSSNVTQGTLSLSFTWTNFTRIEDGTLYVDDVLDTGSGPWLSGLTDSQTLVVRAPENFGIDDATVPPESGELRWEGPTTFTNQTLQSSFVGQGANLTPTPTPTPTDPTPSSPTPGVTPGESSNMLPPLVAGIAALVVLAVLVFRRDEVATILRTDDKAADSAETDPEPDADSAGETAAPTAGAAGTESAATTTDEAVDTELLSDEERVERLLERNDGRMKQASIVKETDWSNAKVSQLLSSMDDDDRIDKLRIGRENLISLPEEDITDFDSDN